MKHIKGQNGYALLIVLLMVVLFLGLSATFMAGSLNNVKQEQTIDTSNQSVAAAEMGVRYYSADFQREINIIKRAILQETQTEIDKIIECFNNKEQRCDQQSELTALEEEVETKMKEKYIDLVEAKVNQLVGRIGHKETPFPGEDVHYAISNVAIKELNSSKEDVALSGTTDTDIRFLQVEIEVLGESKDTDRNLKGRFTLAVPNTVLSEDKSLTMETKTESAIANLLFKETVPTKTCASLRTDIETGNLPYATECIMSETSTAEGFKDFLLSKGLNPKDFTVYAKDFKRSFCSEANTSSTSCTQKMLNGLTVVASPGDPLFSNTTPLSLTGLSSSNTIINGLLTIGSMNNTSTYSTPPDSQTIAVRELHVTGDISGSGLRYTNLVVLGKKSEHRNADSIMRFDKEIRIGDYGKVCFDLDRILSTDKENFRQKVKFSETIKSEEGMTEAQKIEYRKSIPKIIYYTKTANQFLLPADTSGDNRLTSEQKTAKYVKRTTSYEEFINSCGGNVATKSLTEIPTPFINDSGVDIDVEY